MTTLYLGIGYPKTATTSIQRFLIDNRHYLWKLGYYYPLTGIVRRSGNYNSPARYGHANLAWELKQLPAYDPHAGDIYELLREINALNPQHVLLHEESLFNLKLEQIIQLRDKLNEYDVKIIVYLRRQDKWVESYYCQFIKMFLPNFTHAFNVFLSDELSGTSLNYYETLSNWAQVFGKENIIVRIFEDEIKKGIQKSYISTVGIDCDQLPNDFFRETGIKSENITPSIKMIKVLRLINILLNKFSPLSKAQIRYVGYKFLIERDFMNGLVNSIPDIFISNQLLTPSERKSLIESFKKSNNMLASEFLNRSDFWGLVDSER